MGILLINVYEHIYEHLYDHIYEHLYDHLYENTLRSAFSAFAERRAPMQYRHDLKMCSERYS